ncbi:MAG: hypothetical protein V9E86_04335 [Nitrosomonas sp.]
MNIENKFDSNYHNMGYLGVNTDFSSNSEPKSEGYLGINTDLNSISNLYSTQDMERNSFSTSLINRGISGAEQAILTSSLKYGLGIKPGLGSGLFVNVLGGNKGFDDNSFIEMVADASADILIGSFASEVAMNMGINALFFTAAYVTESNLILLSATVGTALVVEVAVIVALSGTYTILKHEFGDINIINNFLQPAYRDLERDIYNLYNIN